MSVLANGADNAFTVTFGANLVGSTLPLTANVTAGTATATVATGSINVPINENFRLTGTGIQNSGALQNVAGSNTINGNVTLAQDANFSPSTTPSTTVALGIGTDTESPSPNSGDSLTINGVISQAAGTTAGLNKVGPDLLILNPSGGNNTYGGVTTVSSGILRIQQSGALGTAGGVPTNGTVVLAGAALQLDGSVTALNVSGETLILNGTGSNSAGPWRTSPAAATSGPAPSSSAPAKTTPWGRHGHAADRHRQRAGPGVAAVHHPDRGGGQHDYFHADLQRRHHGRHSLQRHGRRRRGRRPGRPQRPADHQQRRRFRVGHGQRSRHHLHGQLPGHADRADPAAAERRRHHAAGRGRRDRQPGATPPANLVKSGNGTVDFASANSYTGTTFINAGALRIQNAGALGSTSIAEVQQVGLTGATAGTTQFKLSFNGVATAPILFTGTAANATAVQTALKRCPPSRTAAAR